MKKAFNYGFTLVELAIVLVIVALMASGVLAGQQIIEQAHLSRLSSDIKNYMSAVEIFKAKYNGYPGDLSNASTVGLDRDKTGTQNVSKTNFSNNNGDGDNHFEGYGFPTSYGMSGGEDLNFWIHLSNAAVIKAQFQQVNDCNYFNAGNRCTTTAGAAYPKTSIGGGIVVILMNSRLYFVTGVGESLPHGAFFSKHEGDSNSILSETLTPYQAYFIDSKFDDGKPNSGKAYIYGEAEDEEEGGYGYNALSSPEIDPSPGTTDCFDEGAETYNLILTTKVCSIAIRYH